MSWQKFGAWVRIEASVKVWSGNEKFDSIFSFERFSSENVLAVGQASFLPNRLSSCLTGASEGGSWISLDTVWNCFVQELLTVSCQEVNCPIGPIIDSLCQPGRQFSKKKFHLTAAFRAIFWLTKMKNFCDSPSSYSFWAQIYNPAFFLFLFGSCLEFLKAWNIFVKQLFWKTDSSFTSISYSIGLLDH